MLTVEPDAQIAMIMAKCDMSDDRQDIEDVQARVHTALLRAAPSCSNLDRVTYYKTSAKTTLGVDELFRDIGEP